jgi:amino acid transporter
MPHLFCVVPFLCGSGTASALGDEEANAGRHRMDDSAARGDNQGNPTKPLVKSGDSEVAPPETSGHWLSKYLPRGSARWSRKIVEKYWGIRQFLLLLTLLGTCGVLSDGVLTPSVSILSAIGGLSSGNVNLTQGQVVAVTCAILVALFLFQRFGTEKVAFTFSPIVLIWFCFISSIGVYNIAKYKPGIFECLNPYYSFDFLVRNKTTGWIALGQVILCITGMTPNQV